MPDANGHFKGYALSDRGRATYARIFPHPQHFYCSPCGKGWEDHRTDPGKCPECGFRDTQPMTP